MKIKICVKGKESKLILGQLASTINPREYFMPFKNICNILYVIHDFNISFIDCQFVMVPSRLFIDGDILFSGILFMKNEHGR